jgi:hypothetical protein
MGEFTGGMGEGPVMRNPELHRLHEEFSALYAVERHPGNNHLLTDLELVQHRIERLAARAGVRIEPSPYLDFLLRLRVPVAAEPLAASA